MLKDDEARHQKQAEEGRKMHKFTVVRGAKLELNDVGSYGVLVQISNPTDIDDCVSIFLEPTDANMMASWMQIYTAKYRGKDYRQKGKKGDGGD